MRKVLIVVVALVVLAAVGFFVWAGLLVGLSGARARMVPTTRAGDLYAQLRTLHKGAPPCLRYPEQVGDAEAAEVAKALVQAGLVRSELSELVGLFHDWNDALEKPLHDAASEDEMFDHLVADKGLVDRLIVKLYKSRLAEQERKLMSRHRSTGQETWNLLSAQKQETLRAVHARHPAAFTVGGLLRVVRSMSVEITRARMERLAKKIEEYRAAKGEPQRLEEVASGADLRDDWGSPFDFDGTRLVSLGSDRSPGGDGEFADLVVTLGVAAKPACPPLPARAKLTRSEVEAALEDPVTATTCRILPSFVNGQVQGFKIAAIREGTFPARAGFCNGDIVLSVDGMPLSSPDKALEVYSKLKGARQAVFRMLRAGAEDELTVVAE